MADQQKKTKKKEYSLLKYSFDFLNCIYCEIFKPKEKTTHLLYLQKTITRAGTWWALHKLWGFIRNYFPYMIVAIWVLTFLIVTKCLLPNASLWYLWVRVSFMLFCWFEKRFNWRMLKAPPVSSDIHILGIIM